MGLIITELEQNTLEMIGIIWPEVFSPLACYPSEIAIILFRWRVRGLYEV